ncbi:ribosome biogenesis protein SLX9 homolog [Onthophagus taurus]|uniref:ribosome biogenesis protein SLX9 homolog n=1 Tax=Onthophagus taurus TaxID=166361 RepID=UPI000C20504D|nr:protein FAM207A-like [Onthophagus taurus]
MGKLRRNRNKLHLSNNNNQKDSLKNEKKDTSPDFKLPPVVFPSNNPFADLNIDVSSLNKLKNDDVVSVKSFKSLKSELSAKTNTLSKKDKLKLKKDLLLRKIDTVNQLKKEAKLKKKRSKVAIIGDTNTLRDALPDLESLIKSSGDDKPKEGVVKKKAIAKERKRKKNMALHLQIYKNLMNNNDFKKDPLGAISDHVKAVSENKQL